MDLELGREDRAVAASLDDLPQMLLNRVTVRIGDPLKVRT
jgi:hypothetical protein